MKCLDHIRVMLVSLMALALLAGDSQAQDPQTWIAAEPMPTARSGVAAAAIGRYIYVAGGRDDRGQPLNVLERFDVEEGTWTTLPPMPTERFGAAAVAYRGLFFVIGGSARRGGGPNQRRVLNLVEVYDPNQNVWKTLPALREERVGHAAFVLRDTLYVAGGSNRSERILGSVEHFTFGEDGGERSWALSTQLRLGIPTAAMAVAVVGERAFSFGGFAPVPVNFVQDFSDPALQVEPPAGVFVARGGHAAVAMGDTVYILGGVGPLGDPSTPGNPVLSDVSLFMASSRTWSRGPTMREARESFAAVAVGRQLYVIGGRDEDERSLSSVDVLDIGEGTAAEGPAVPADFYLRQSAPNPFRDHADIAFSVSARETGTVRLEVFDLQGRRVRTLISGTLAPGSHRASFDGRSDGGARLAGGVYLYRLTQGSHRAHQKLILIP